MAHHGIEIGCYVKTRYIPEERSIVRKVTDVKKGFSHSGILMSADGGENGTEIKNVDADWFVIVNNPTAK